MATDEKAQDASTRVGNDNDRTIAARKSINERVPQGLGADILMGVRFFSRLPTGKSAHQKPDLSRITQALPFTSLLISLLPAIVLLLVTLLKLPPLTAAFIGIGAMIMVSGAMAEDAIGDSADGLVGGQTSLRRLEIFKDSRLGTYGVTAIIMYVGIRVSIVAAFLAQNVFAAILLWSAAQMLSRSAALWLSVKLAPARADGASASGGQVSQRAFIIGGTFAILIAFIFSAPFVGWLGFCTTLIVIAGIVWLWSRLCMNLVGGQTGDLIGGLQAILEIAILSAFIIFFGQ